MALPPVLGNSRRPLDEKNAGNEFEHRQDVASSQASVSTVKVAPEGITESTVFGCPELDLKI